MSKVRDMVRLNKRIVVYRDDYGWPVHIKSTKDGRLANRVSAKMTDFMRTRNEQTQQVSTFTAEDEVILDSVDAIVRNTDTSPGQTIENGRGACPECGTRQKVRKDGTVGKHGDCKGTGQPAL